jgi:hypothetical protein
VGEDGSRIDETRGVVGDARGALPRLSPHGEVLDHFQRYEEARPSWALSSKSKKTGAGSEGEIDLYKAFGIALSTIDVTCTKP